MADGSIELRGLVTLGGAARLQIVVRTTWHGVRLIRESLMARDQRDGTSMKTL